jgi:hypothetical protein
MDFPELKTLEDTHVQGFKAVGLEQNWGIVPKDFEALELGLSKDFPIERDVCCV